MSAIGGTSAPDSAHWRVPTSVCSPCRRIAGGWSLNTEQLLGMR